MTDRSISRREALAAAGVTISGLAGCASGGTNPEGNNQQTTNSKTGTSKAVDEVVFGLIVPLSGPYSNQGKRIKQAVQLAGQQAVEAGEIGDFNLLVGDSKTTPSGAVQVAREHLRKGADILQGGLTGASAAAVAELASRNDVLHLGGISTAKSDLQSCHSHTFYTTGSMRSFAQKPLGYINRNGLGKKVYQIHTSASWPQAYNDFVTGAWSDNRDLEFITTKGVPFGTKDYSSIMNDVKQSDVDILNIVLYGTDALSAMKQVVEFGLLDTVITVADPIVQPGFGSAIPQELFRYEDSYWGLTGGYVGIDSPAMDQYAKTVKEKFGFTPGQEVVWYNPARTALRAVEETGTTETTSLIDALKGHDLVPDLWGTSPKFRPCDQRTTQPAITLQGNPDGNHDQGEYFKVVEKLSDPAKIMFPCDRIATC